MEMLLFLVFLLICSFVRLLSFEKFFFVWLVWVLWWWNFEGMGWRRGGFFEGVRRW